jgi:BlaI family transcriptional regulator, penicillinase repressor
VESSEPTPRELEALKVLWSKEEGATVREVCDAISATVGEELAYTTVLSLLQVMEQKGLVDHARQGRAYVYRPLVERRKTLGQIAGGFLESVFDGALGEYVAHAIDKRGVSRGELDELEALLIDARKKQAGGKKKPANASRRNRKKGDS